MAFSGSIKISWLVVVVSVAWTLSACDASGIEDVTKFCPKNKSQEIILDFEIYEPNKKILLDSVLRNLDERGISYEEVYKDLAPRHCSEYISTEGATAYRVYFGKDLNGARAKNYLVVSDEDGVVVFIEARHSYLAP